MITAVSCAAALMLQLKMACAENSGEDHVTVKDVLQSTLVCEVLTIAPAIFVGFARLFLEYSYNAVIAFVVIRYIDADLRVVTYPYKWIRSPGEKHRTFQ